MRLLKIGRDSSCDIVLQSQMVSALHAEMTILNNGDILLEDKNSRNGTFIMNRLIKPNAQVNVKRGDAIRFADVELSWDQVPLPEDNSNYKAIYGIGSNFRNEIQVSGNTVSRFHATLKIDRKGHAILQDHSKNGTMVNGRRIGNGQSVSVSRGDRVVCGGVPVNIAPYLPAGFSVRKVASIAAAILVIIGCGYGVWYWAGNSGRVSPKTSEALEKATACVYGGYYYVVTLKDDPFKGNVNGWPEQWIFGHDGNGNLVNLNDDHYNEADLVDLSGNYYCNSFEKFNGEALPFFYTGTAFFISEDGEMGTNRHIAVPWEYIESEHKSDILNYIKGTCTTLGEELAESTSDSDIEFAAKLSRIITSDVDINGSFVFLGVGLAGSKIESVSDLHRCQVIAESGDVKKDVAIIRLNTRRTPDDIVELGAIYDIEKARVDERSLKVQDENFTIIGYPGGEVVSNESFNGKELHPSSYRATLSMRPDEYQMQIQSVTMGGESGSPVIDRKHRLVGVLCSSFSGTQVTYCCNIKHLKELYDRHKVR